MGIFDIFKDKNQSKNDDSGRTDKATKEYNLYGKKYYLIKNKVTGKWDICTNNLHNPPLEKYIWAADFVTAEEAEKYLKETLTNLRQGITIQEKEPDIIERYPSGVTVSTWTPERGGGRKPLVEESSKSKTHTTKTNKKYKLLDTDTTKATYGDITLYRIEAKKSFGNIKKGSKGGYIESEENLSVEGNAWVADKARVWDDAEVTENALVAGNAQVYHRARVSGDAKVYGNARVNGDSQVYDKAKVYGDSEIYGDAQIKDSAEVYDTAKVKGNALIYGKAKIHGKGWVGFNQEVGGDREVIRDIMIDEMHG